MGLERHLAGLRAEGADSGTWGFGARLGMKVENGCYSEIARPCVWDPC